MIITISNCSKHEVVRIAPWDWGYSDHQVMYEIIEEPCSSRRPSSDSDEDMILETFKIGTFVTAVFGDSWFICEVVGEGDVLKVPLKYMESRGKNKFVWSNDVEPLHTFKDDILCKVPPPVPQGSALAWSFGLHKDDLKKTQRKFLLWLGRNDC